MIFHLTKSRNRKNPFSTSGKQRQKENIYTDYKTQLLQTIHIRPSKTSLKTNENLISECTNPCRTHSCVVQIDIRPAKRPKKKQNTRFLHSISFIETQKQIRQPTPDLSLNNTSTIPWRIQRSPSPLAMTAIINLSKDENTDGTDFSQFS